MPGVPRGIVPDRQEQLRAALRRRRGIRSATAGPASAPAFGIFYDALAGQGDFFQSGVLSPPFTPLIELNTPTADHAGATRCARWPARRTRSRAALTIIGWGDDFESPYAYHFNVGVQQQIGVEHSAPRSPTSARAATTCRSSSRSTRASTRPARRRAARASCRPSRWCARPSRSAQSWYDSLQASAAHAADAAASTSSRPTRWATPPTTCPA